jgi:hypothetical protein
VNLFLLVVIGEMNGSEQEIHGNKKCPIDKQEKNKRQQ